MVVDFKRAYYMINHGKCEIKVYFFLSLSLLAGCELIYRNRDGDVIKFNVDTDEKTILVHKKKFVSILPSFPPLYFLIQKELNN